MQMYNAVLKYLNFMVNKVYEIYIIYRDIPNFSMRMR